MSLTFVGTGTYPPVSLRLGKGRKETTTEFESCNLQTILKIDFCGEERWQSKVNLPGDVSVGDENLAPNESAVLGRERR
jgi:hypothetical protein